MSSGVSANGLAVAGYSQDGGAGHPGVLWNISGTQLDFGLEPGRPLHTVSYGLSRDGSTVVGTAGNNGQPAGAFRYRPAHDGGVGTYETLGLIAGARTMEAHDANLDGSVVVGWGTDSSGIAQQAFMWAEDGGMQALGWTRQHHFLSEAHAVSADGLTVVGESSGVSDGDAFLWTSSAGMTILPAAIGSTYSVALGLNGDASIIVGETGSTEAAIWRHGSLEVLGRFEDRPTRLLDVSDDGSLAVGEASPLNGAQEQGLVWTPAGGFQSARSYLVQHGVLVPSGWKISTGLSVSADGLTISGTLRRFTTRNESLAFVATVPCPVGLIPLFMGCAASRTVRRPR